MCYKEAFADTDVDKSGRLDTRELFNMLRSVSDNGLLKVLSRLILTLFEVETKQMPFSIVEKLY